MNNKKSRPFPSIWQCFWQLWTNFAPNINRPDDFVVSKWFPRWRRRMLNVDRTKAPIFGIKLSEWWRTPADVENWPPNSFSFFAKDPVNFLIGKINEINFKLAVSLNIVVLDIPPVFWPIMASLAKHWGQNTHRTVKTRKRMNTKMWKRSNQ